MPADRDEQNIGLVLWLLEDLSVQQVLGRFFTSINTVMDPPKPDKNEERDKEPDYFQMTSASGIVSYWPTSASVMRQMHEDDKRNTQARALPTETAVSGAKNNVGIPKNPETTTSSSPSEESEQRDSDNDKSCTSSSPGSLAERSSGSNSQGNPSKPAFQTSSQRSAAGLASPTWSDWSRAGRAASQNIENLENSENVVLSPSHANGLAVIASAYADEEDIDEGSVSSGKDSNNEEPNDPNGIIYMGTSQPFQDISNHGNQSNRNRGLQQQSSQPLFDVHLEDLTTSSQVLIVTESSKCRWDRSSSSSGSSGKLIEKNEEEIAVPEDIIGDHHVCMGQGLDEALQQPEAMEESTEEVVVAKPKKVLFRNPRNMKKSGLVFQCHRRFQRRLKKLSILRVSNLAAVYLTGVIEYVTAELLELAGNACKDMKLKRLIPRHILLAIKGDKEFDELLENVLIPQGGVYPYIHKFLTRGRKSKR